MKTVVYLLAEFRPDAKMRSHRIRRGFNKCTVGMTRYLREPLRDAVSKAAGDAARPLIREINKIDYDGRCERFQGE